MPEPFEAITGKEAILRRKRLTIEDADGTDLIRLGPDDDGSYGFSLYDSNALLRGEIGRFSDGHYGVRTVLPDGTELFRSDERGLITPPLAVPMVQRTSGGEEYTTNSGSWTGMWYGVVPKVVHPAFELTVSVGQAVGVTGQVRAVLRATGGADLATSNAYTVTAAARLRLAWLHGVAVPRDRVEVRVEMRVSSGSGNVLSKRPYGVYFTGPDGMAGSGGAWTDVTGE